MNNQELWHLIRKAWGEISPHYTPVLERWSDESELNFPTWGLLFAALTFEPETISPHRLQVRGPYTAAEGYLTRLQAAARKGYLEEVAPAEYRLTDTGRAQTEYLIDELRAAMAAADPLPAIEEERLAHLLDQLIEASINTPPPPDTWSIVLSQRLMPTSSPPLPYVEQAISCLAAYRDDAHLAAWQPSGLSATALETLTLLWRGDADSLDAVGEALAHRNHPRQVYAAALAELRECGFVEGPDNGPRVTETGRAFRDQVETVTDQFFYAPWACLDATERAELANLSIRLRDGLRSPGGSKGDAS